MRVHWYIVPLLIAVFSLLSCGKTFVPEFDGDKAFEYLTAQTDFGPRNPGSAGHEACRDYLTAELTKYADSVKRQPFSFTDEHTDTTYTLTNIIASFNLLPAENNRILLTAHWDTRPYADNDPDQALHETPIIGANDGASGTAVLLHIASILSAYPPDIGVDIVLFDGEDYGKSDVNGLDYFFLGSRYFTQTMGDYRPDYAVLLDMVGGRNARFFREGYSREYAPLYQERIWNTAEELGLTVFVQEYGPRISDDHLILNRGGIPSVDIIDINGTSIGYPYWHTVEDTPDKCSPETLAQVGTLLLNLIYD